MKLKKCIKILKNPSEPNTQLDFFNKKGDSLMQVFNIKDYKIWFPDLELKNSEGLIFTLYLSKIDEFKKDQFLRFKKSNISKFCKNHLDDNHFYYEIPMTFSDIEIEKMLKDTIDTVYVERNVHYTLNAY